MDRLSGHGFRSLPTGLEQAQDAAFLWLSDVPLSVSAREELQS